MSISIAGKGIRKLNGVYFDNVDKTVIAANRYAFDHAVSAGTLVASKAWDNVKRKNKKRYTPRGQVYDRIQKLINNAYWSHFEKETASLIARMKGNEEPI
jgi:hypothetical protein